MKEGAFAVSGRGCRLGALHWVGKGASGVGLGDSVSHGHVRVPPQNHPSSFATNCECIFEFAI